MQKLTTLERELLAALKEAVAVVEGHPTRSPFVAVEDWKGTVAKAERASIARVPAGRN